MWKRSPIKTLYDRHLVDISIDSASLITNRPPHLNISRSRLQGEELRAIIDEASALFDDDEDHIANNINSSNFSTNEREIFNFNLEQPTSSIPFERVEPSTTANVHPQGFHYLSKLNFHYGHDKEKEIRNESSSRKFNVTNVVEMHLQFLDSTENEIGKILANHYEISFYPRDVFNMYKKFPVEDLRALITEQV